MAVYKDTKRNTWYAMIRYTDDEGKPISKIKRGFVLKRDAIIFENEFRKSLESTGQHPTLREIFKEYLSLSSSSEETKSNITQKYNTFLLKYENQKIRSFNSSKITSIVHEIRSSNYSKSYKNYALSHFKAILKHAALNYGINTRYDIIKKLPKTSEDSMNFDTWNDEEFNKFIQAIQHPVYKSLFIVLYRTGLRRGEALALEYSDLAGNELSITKAYRRGKGALKNVSSIRTILLDELTIETLNFLKEDNGYLFFGGQYYLSLSTIDRYFKQGIKDSKVKPIRLHDLRHSHATNLINKGANLVAVSKRLGHANIQMTIQTYTNVLKETDEALLKLI